MDARGFSSWLTLSNCQDQVTGRRWHMFFAWLLVAKGIAPLPYGFLSGASASGFRRNPQTG